MARVEDTTVVEVDSVEVDSVEVDSVVAGVDVAEVEVAVEDFKGELVISLPRILRGNSGINSPR